MQLAVVMLCATSLSGAMQHISRNLGSLSIILRLRDEQWARFFQIVVCLVRFIVDNCACASEVLSKCVASKARM